MTRRKLPQPASTQLVLPLDGLPIPGFPGHFISRTGIIQTPKRKGVTGSPDVSGYLRTVLNRTSIFVHKLVAMTYVPNPHGHPRAYFLNGNITDIRPENLGWGSVEDIGRASALRRHRGKL